MEEEIVSFQVAKLAKEKGFNWKVGLHYESNGNRFFNKVECNFNNVELICSAPTQALLQKWLREVHGIILEITWQMCSTGYEYAVIDMNNPPKYEDDIERIIGFKSYEEALEVGFYEGLKLIEDIEKV